LLVNFLLKMKSLLFVVGLLFFINCWFSLSFSSPPQKPIWPIQFSVMFGMYYKSIQNSTSMLYYDFDIQAQMIDYQLNCIPGMAPNSDQYPCKIYFNSTGVFLSQPANDITCCLAFPGVGTVPPNFLGNFTYKNLENADDYYGNSHKCDHWTGPDFFGYWTDATSMIDIQFKDGPTGVFWQFAPFNVGSQDPSLFVTPEPCQATCPPAADSLDFPDFSAEKHILSLQQAFQQSVQN